MSFYDFNETPENADKIKEAIDQSDSLRLAVRKIRAADSALLEFASAENEFAFNKYFLLGLNADLGEYLKDGSDTTLRKIITHGLIITCPNVKDEDLPDHAIAARERAVDAAMEAAKKIESTRAGEVWGRNSDVRSPG